MRNLVASLIAVSILGASSLAAADEPAPATAPVASPVVAPVAPAIAALPVIAPPPPLAPPPPPLGRAEQRSAIAAEPRIRSRALVYGGVGATGGGLAVLTFGIWAVSQPVSPPYTVDGEM